MRNALPNDEFRPPSRAARLEFSGKIRLSLEAEETDKARAIKSRNSPLIRSFPETRKKNKVQTLPVS